MEVAPTMYGSWEELFSGTAAIPGNPVAMQSLLFGKGYNIYSDLVGWLGHMNAVAGLARAAGCRYLVFGSPLSRKFPAQLLSRNNGFSAAELYMAGVLCDLADNNPDIIFGLEANPTQYGANTATNADEATRIVRLAARGNIRFHADSGCLRLAGDDPVEALKAHSDIITRCHVSMPNLKPYDGSEKEFISIAISLGLGISYEARSSADAEEAASLFFLDIERAIT